MTTLQSQVRTLDMTKPVIAGILNCTPDSFSDGGKFSSAQDAIEYGLKLESDGALWLDIGGESSGPNSVDVAVDEELERVIPVIQGIRQRSNVWISVDTYKAEVARQAINAGADAINDVTALRREPHMAEIIAESGAAVVLVFSKEDNARTTTKFLQYDDVLESLKSFFQERMCWIQQHGVPLSKIVLDPGLGFFVSSDAQYSFEIIRRLKELHALGQPLMVGVSRKSFLSNVWQPLEVHERESPSLIAASVALMNGAKIVRMHNVKETRLALSTLQSIYENSF